MPIFNELINNDIYVTETSIHYISQINWMSVTLWKKKVGYQTPQKSSQMLKNHFLVYEIFSLKIFLILYGTKKKSFIRKI